MAKINPVLIQCRYRIHNSQKCKQPKCPSVDGWINKMWYMHTMEYYSALKRKEILTHAYNKDEP